MSDWKNVQYKDGKYKTDNSGGGGSSTFAELDDVSISNVQDGQVPKYNSSTQKWENANESGGTVKDVEVNGASVVNSQGVAQIVFPSPPTIPDELSDMSDVNISTPSNGQVLKYDDTTNKWINAEVTSALAITEEVLMGTETTLSRWADPMSLQISLSSYVGFGIEIPLSNQYNRKTTYFITAGQLSGKNESSSDKYIVIPPNTSSGYIHKQLWLSYVGGNFNIRVSTNENVTISRVTGLRKTNIHKYSTTEQIVGEWIDGKPIYEKTFSNVSLTRGQWTQISHGIQNIGTKISMEGLVIRDSDGWSAPFEHYEDGSVYIRSEFNNTYVEIKVNISSGSYKANITVRYTKTTD